MKVKIRVALIAEGEPVGLLADAEIDCSGIASLPLVVIVARFKEDGEGEMHALNLYNSASGVPYLPAATCIVESLRASNQHPEIQMQQLRGES